MGLRELPRLARTLRPLRPSQLAWRGRYALERRLPAPHIRLPVAYGEHELRHQARPDGVPEVPLHRRAEATPDEIVSRLSEGVFRHLNLALPLGRMATDWRLGPQSEHRLWTITLHYHEWLHELAEAIRGGGPQAALAGELLAGYLADWLARCDLAQPGARDLAWNSYAIGTRIGWWIRAHRLLGRDWWDGRGELHARFLGSLWRQAEFLYGHPEWDLRGNHILRNAVGLAWAGRFFQGERPRLWMAAAETIAADQIDEQILPDGGHFERSPMYHVHVMHDIEALSLLVEDESLRRDLNDACRAMRDYIAWMRHPDGGLSQFNDGETLPAISGAPRQEPVRGARHFPASGFCVWHGEPWSVFVDVGEVGPDCQPGHAHADTLSLECSFRGARLFVDPGTHGYDDDARRRYDRSTAAHNTVSIDGRDSSEMWHVFRVGRRARPVDVRVDYSPRHMAVEAAHTGYDGLAGAPRHWRRVAVSEAGELRIADRVTGGGSHAVSGGWLLAPGWNAAPAGEGWDLSYGERRVSVRLACSSPVSLSIEPAAYHPEYGLEVTTTRLVWRYSGGLPLFVKTVVAPD